MPFRFANNKSIFTAVGIAVAAGEIEMVGEKRIPALHNEGMTLPNQGMSPVRK